ncbi:MAG: hypothetical protein ACTSPY_05905 [Candidatus Helarchaeota archaeon]
MKYRFFVPFVIFIFIWTSSLILMPSIKTNQQVVLYSEDFSSSPATWSFTNAINYWEIGNIPFGVHSGDGMGLGTILGGDYLDNIDEMIEVKSPTINFVGYVNVKLSFYHWYNFSDSQNDGGGIYLWNGSDYINPLNKFPSAISGDLNFHVINGLAYTGHPNELGWGYNSSGQWKQVILDLKLMGFQNSDFTITFVFGEESLDSIHGEGWYIDDIQIVGEISQKNNTWFWILLLIIGITTATGITIGIKYYYGKDSGKYEIGNDTTKPQTQPTTTTTPESTPTSTPTTTSGKSTPTTTTPTTTTTTPTTTTTTTPKKIEPKVPKPVSVKPPPKIKWFRPMGEYESDNPLNKDGYYYEIIFEIPCTITPTKDQVIIAHVVFTITVKCKNGTHTYTYDYWEAFTIHDPKEDKTTTRDKHYIDRSQLEADIYKNTNCDKILSYTVTREHTIGLGTVSGADWNNQMDGGAFAYLKYGPPPDNKKSTPSTRPNARVSGSVTSFSKINSTKFEGTYTYDAQTGKSTYKSSLNPNKTYTHNIK